MSTTLTIRIDDELRRRLDAIADESGNTRSDIVREALRRHLSIVQFEQLRRKTMPFAEAQGLLTDEDVFRDVS